MLEEKLSAVIAESKMFKLSLEEVMEILSIYTRKRHKKRERKTASDASSSRSRGELRRDAKA
jgi:hypothetical protein